MNMPSNDSALPQLPQEALDYLRHIEVERRLSPLTCRLYHDDLQRLFTPLAGKITPWSLMTSAHIRRQMSHEHQRGCGSATLSRYLSSWRSFFRWLIAEGKMTHNPVSKVRAPKASRKLPTTLTTDQMLGMLDNIQTHPTLQADHVKKKHTLKPLHAARDRAMYELFYSSGLRLSELIGIDVTQVRNLLQGELSVLGKRQKERIIPVGTHAINAIHKWLPLRQSIIDSTKSIDHALFINDRGTRMSPRSVQANMARWAKTLGLPMHVHPHMLRHSFASHVLQSSGDLRAVQEMLGHTSIRATQVYTHLDFQALAKVYDRAHPRAHQATSPPHLPANDSPPKAAH